jgi:hypothetical protein
MLPRGSWYPSYDLETGSCNIMGMLDAASKAHFGYSHHRRIGSVPGTHGLLDRYLSHHSRGEVP